MDNNNIFGFGYDKANILFDTLNIYLRGPIRDRYQRFDPGHNTKHFDEVYEEAIDLAKISMKLGYFSPMELIKDSFFATIIAAAYHDTGLEYYGRKTHEICSVVILREDKELYNILKEYYCGVYGSTSGIVFLNTLYDLASNAIFNHRSSKIGTCQIDYIIKDSDKVSTHSKDRIMERYLGYNVYTYPLDTRDQNIDKLVQAYNSATKFNGIMYSKAGQYKYKDNTIAKVTREEVEKYYDEHNSELIKIAEQSKQK